MKKKIAGLALDIALVIAIDSLAMVILKAISHILMILRLKPFSLFFAWNVVDQSDKNL